MEVDMRQGYAELYVDITIWVQDCKWTNYRKKAHVEQLLQKENKHQKENHQLNQHKKQYKKQLKQKFKQQVLLKQYKIMMVNVNLLVTKYYNNDMSRMNILLVNV